jgi:hypothetical protein
MKTCNLKIYVVILLSIIATGVVSRGFAQEHDHQAWNVNTVGKIVSISRFTDRICEKPENIASCVSKESEKAVSILMNMIAQFGCRPMGEIQTPTLDVINPLTKHDFGKLIIAEIDSLMCSSPPSTQMIPAEPGEFKNLCSQIDWKCDLVWIADGDPSVWYINRYADIPK